MKSNGGTTDGEYIGSSVEMFATRRFQTRSGVAALSGAASIRTRSSICLTCGATSVLAGLTPESDEYAIPDTIETVGGAKPKTFEAFVREEQSALAA